MKIGILATYFYPAIGGVESVILNQAIALAKNHEVHVFTSDRKGKEIFKKEETYKNIHIHRSKTWFRYKYYLAFYPGLIKNLLKYDLDLVHVHSLGFFQQDLAAIIKKWVSHKTKFICSPYGPFMALGNYSSFQLLLKKIYLPFEKLVNKIYDTFIQINPYQYEQLKNYGVDKNKLKLITPAADNQIFEPAQKKIKEKLTKKFHLENKLVLSYMGRIQKYKGLDQVVQCLPDLNKIKETVFVAIGENAEDKKRLLTLAKSLGVEKNIVFPGRVSEEEKNALLEISEIFVFPSEQEAFGIAMLEAMAKANAVISTKTEGGRYLIKKENGFVYNFQDVDDLKKKLLKLSQNKNLMNKMQKNNSIKAKNFTWKKVNDELIKLYNSI
jgi:1,2-diacylglycerol 3-alpha-glucosyltransferase